MILSKLQEALAEIGVQIAALDVKRSPLVEVQSELRQMISKLSAPALGEELPSTLRFASPRTASRDKLDDIADILRAEGKPLHITTIAERLSTLKGKNIARTQIEPGMNRHIAKAKERRIKKFGPSTFGLPEWRDGIVQGNLTDVA